MKVNKKQDDIDIDLNELKDPLVIEKNEVGSVFVNKFLMKTN